MLKFEEFEIAIEGFNDPSYSTERRINLACWLAKRSCLLVDEIKRLQKTKEMPKIVCFCGSSRFCEIMAVCAWLIEREEKAIVMGLHLLPYWYTQVPSHLAEHEGVSEAMDELHLRKIDVADEIFVLNRDDYIGDSTREEINYAQEHGKKLRWYTHDKVGILVEKIIQEFIKKQEGKHD